MMSEPEIILGDALDVLEKIQTNSIDLVLSDPPYFLPINSYIATRGNQYEKRTMADTSILKGFFKQIFSQLDRITKESGTWYIFCDGQSYPIFYECAFPYCKYVRPIIWDKMISYNGYTWRHQHEIILWGERPTSKRIETGDGDIIKCRGVLQKDRNHPAEKPVELLRKLIKKHPHYTKIIDPFMGSGSTLIAGLDLKKEMIGIELNEDNFKKTINRIDEKNKTSLESFL